MIGISKRTRPVTELMRNITLQPTFDKLENYEVKDSRHHSTFRSTSDKTNLEWISRVTVKRTHCTHHKKII